MTVGHEFSGEVVQTGSGVTDVAVGDLCERRGTWSAADVATALVAAISAFTLEPSAFTSTASSWRSVALHSGNAWVHRDPIEPGVAAIFDPFGNAVHTALAFPMLGEDVLVTEPDRSASWRPW